MMNKKDKYAIFFRVSEDELQVIERIKTDYKYRSTSAVVKACVNVLLATYELHNRGDRRETLQEELEDIFNEYFNGEVVFEYTKNKKARANYLKGGEGL